MALPSTGQLSLKDIGVELGITAGNQASLRSMSSTAGKSTPDTVSEFYGYSHVSDITLSWGATGSYLGDPYRAVDRANHVSPQIITINFLYYIGYTNATGRIYTSVNSTSSWSQKAVWLAGSSISGSFSQTSVDYNDIIRVRFQKGTTTIFGQRVNLNNGTLTSGTPVVSVTGTGIWYP